MHRCILVFVLALLVPVSGVAGETWLRVPADQVSQRSALPPEAIDYGSFIWLPAAADPDGRSRAAPGTVAVDNPFLLRVDGKTIDPIADLPSPPAPSGEPDFHLVQFQGPIKAEWLSALESVGFALIQPLHPFSYIVWGQAENLPSRQSRAVPRVRWSGAYHPVFRGRAAPDKGPESEVGFNAVVFAPAADEVAAELAALGAVVEGQRPFRAGLAVMRGTIINGAIAQAAAIRGVFTIQARPDDGGLRGEWADQSITGGFAENSTDPEVIWESGYLDWLTTSVVSGAGVTVGIVDSGIEEAHDDLAKQMVPCVTAGEAQTSCTKNATLHGTHVAGLVAGDASTGASSSATLEDPDGFLWGLGVAPGAQLIQQRFNEFWAKGFPPGTMTTIFQETAMSGGVLANNSWGHASTPQGYDQLTMEVDMAVRDARPDMSGQTALLPVFAIMNGSGDNPDSACPPSSLGAPDEAKNILAVGSNWLLGSESDPNFGHNPKPFSISDNSGHGPACDGRLVPDLTSPGCDTISPGGVSSQTGNSTHVLMCGTSMAAPVVTGAVSIFFDQYRQNQGRDPSPALTRVVFTATATDLAGETDADGNVLGHRPDRKQGWGRIDLDAVINPPAPIWMFDQEFIFTATGETWSADFAAVDAAEPVRVQLAWTDAPGPGLGGTTPAWVNNLDLGVTASAGAFFGNVFDPANGFAATGGSPDDKNNLEGVHLRADQHTGASFTVDVLAADVSADALDPFSPGLPRQDFALACINCLPAAMVSISSLQHEFDGEPKPVTVTTTPGGLNFDVTYDGVVTAPSEVGEYLVRAEIQDDDFAGRADATLTIVRGAQTVTFDPIPGRSADDSLSVPLTASASSGLPVEFSVLAGPATVTGETLELTGQVGTVEVEARQPGSAQWQPADPIARTFDVQAGAPAALEIVEGNNQVATVNEAVDIPPAVRVVDQFGNPLADVEVAFRITEGGGLLTGASALSGADGIARVGSWVLGTPPGTKRLEAALTASPDVAAVFTAQAEGKPATVTLSGLNQVFDGDPKPVAVTTEPAGLTVQVTYNDETVVPADAGTYAVQAVVVDDEYVGEASGTLEIVPAAQVITFESIADRTAGQALSFFPAVSASSGLTVEIEILSGPATASGELIELTGAVGTVEVRATQAGTSNWLPADPVTRRFDVVPGAPASIQVFAGNNQVAQLGEFVDIPPAAIVRDVRGNPVPDADVAFSVIDGPGWLQAPDASTGADGVARAGGLNVGDRPGTTVIEAAAAGVDLSAARFEALAEAAVDISAAIESGLEIVERGQWVAYQVEFGNAGPEQAFGVTIASSLSDAFDAGTVRWQCSATGGATCPAGSGTSEINAIVDIPANGRLAFVLEARIAQSAPIGEPVVSSVRVTVPEGVAVGNPSQLSNQDSIKEALPEGEMLFSDSFE